MSACKACTSEQAAFRCAGCKSVQYCNAECQQTDWPTHEPICAELRLGRLRLSLGLTPSDEERYARVASRVSGLALGHACGDTLGAQVTGLGVDFLYANIDTLNKLASGDPQATLNRTSATYPDIEPGQLTDATELWLVSARGLLADRSKPRRSVSEWLLKWAATKREHETFGLAAPKSVSRTQVLAPPADDDNSALVRVSVYSIWTWRDSDTRALKDLVRTDVALTHANTDASHAAVAYAIICRALLVGERSDSGRAATALNDALAYLRSAAPSNKAIPAIEEGRNRANLNPFGPDQTENNQALSPDEPDTYHKSLGAVAYFLTSASKTLDGAAFWSAAIVNLMIANGQANVTAALVGETLGAFYGQQALPRFVVGAVLAHYSPDAADWLRGQHLLYLSETLGREAS